MIRTRDYDPFRPMLMWSAAGHVVVFVALVLTAMAQGAPRLSSPPVLAWMVPGVPGAMGSGGGTPAPAPKPAPAPEPPEEKAPKVVRPTKEDRDQLPLPDAKPGKPREKKPSSGLTGPDASPAPSATLKTEAPPGMAGLGLGGTGGGSPFDSDFEYDYYVYQMLSKVRQNWQRAPVRGIAVVIVKFTIFRDGHLDGVEVEQSSNVPLLDRSAERAVYLADPMPPLPNSYPRDRVGVHLRFEYSDRY